METWMRKTCYGCGGEWGACTCPEADLMDRGLDGEAPAAFEWNGFAIINPYVSECGRFYVDPVLYYGDAFRAWQAARAHPKKEAN